MSLKQNLHVVTTTYPKKEKALEEVKHREIIVIKILTKEMHQSYLM